MSSDHCARLHFVYVHPHSAADVSSAHSLQCVASFILMFVPLGARLHLFGTVEIMSFSYTSNVGSLSYVCLTFSYSQIRIV